MKLLIIGANGFLGGGLKKYYQSRGDIVITASYRQEQHSEFIKLIQEELINNDFDLVINAGASQLSKDDSKSLVDLINSNVLMPASLASLIKEHSPETILISFGTSWQIGEDGKYEPFNAYASSKSSVEPFFDHYAQDGIKIATLRLYDTYGPKDKRNKIINLIADSLINRTELAMSCGQQAVDFVYIQDVIDAVELTHKHLISSRKGCHEKFSIRSGRVVTIVELLNIMRNVIRVEDTPWIKLGIYPYRLRERFNLANDYQTVPKWTAFTKLEEGSRLVMLDRGWIEK